MASKWIERATSEEPKMRRGSFRNLAKEYMEPDADDMGGPSDHDADDMKRRKKRPMGTDMRDMGME